MPKPRTLAREQRRLARDLARRDAIRAVEACTLGAPLPLTTRETQEAYLAEVRRIVERMRFQYRLRAEPTPRPELALALGDSARAAGSETGESGA